MSSKNEELRAGLIQKYGPELADLGYGLTYIVDELESVANWAEFLTNTEGLTLRKAYAVVGLELLEKIRQIDPEPPIPTPKRQQEINEQLMKQFFPNRS